MIFDNKDYYPTPEWLVKKMLTDVDLRAINTILEPSAGKGDIVEIIKNKHSNLYNNIIDIDTIEIEQNLIHILKRKRI